MRSKVKSAGYYGARVQVALAVFQSACKDAEDAGVELTFEPRSITTDQLKKVKLVEIGESFL